MQVAAIWILMQGWMYQIDRNDRIDEIDVDDDAEIRLDETSPEEIGRW